jgi:hypothetical protein
MKKRYKIPLIIIAVLFVIFLICVAVKLIFPLQPNVGFHYEASEMVLLDYSDDPDMKLRASCFFWDFADGRYVVTEVNGNVVKFDIETGEITARIQLAENEDFGFAKHRENGNCLLGIGVLEEGKSNYTYILREYTPDLIFIREIPLPEGISLQSSAIGSDVIYSVKMDTETFAVSILTLDENFNILTEETVDTSFGGKRNPITPTVSISADGKPFLMWQFSRKDINDPPEGFATTEFITSFEAKPSFVLELPKAFEEDAFYFAGSGDDDYPIIVNYFPYPQWFDFLLNEPIRGDGFIGVKWDGTTKKLLASNAQSWVMGHAPYYNPGLLFMNGHVYNGDIYYLSEYSADPTVDDSKSLYLHKLTKVYD